MFDRKILRGLMLSLGLALVVALLLPSLALADKDPPVQGSGMATHDAALLELDIDDNGGSDGDLEVRWPCPGDCKDHTSNSSLLVGISPTELADGTWDEDWNTVTALTIGPGVVSDQDGYAQYDVGGALVSQYSCAWENTDFVLVGYVIQNNTGGTITGIYAGHDADLDVEYTPNDDMTAYDAARAMGYACDEDDPYCVGLRYFTGVSSYNNGYCCIVDSDASAYAALSNGQFDSAYPPPANYGDVQFIMGAGPFSLAPGKAYLLGTAWVAGSSLADLQANADEALAKWLESDGCGIGLAKEEEFVPEPGSVVLLASGLMGLAGYAGLRLRKK